MKTLKPGALRYPKLYQVFGTAEEIGRVINRSRSYVNKALKFGFKSREMQMIAEYVGRSDLFEDQCDDNGQIHRDN